MVGHPAGDERVIAGKGAGDVLGRLYASIDAVRTGKNALGIEETDTPLYFLADAAGSGRRFSAISDYLLGDGAPGTSAWAPALTQQAIPVSRRS